MKIVRMFSTETYKGTRNYLRTQKYYEIGRTVLYFCISFALFMAGYITTKSRANLLTIVAVLGCLPASKSLVESVIYCRYKGLSSDNYRKIAPYESDLMIIYDLVFTSYDKNFEVMHLAIRGNTVCGFTENTNFDVQGFQKHIQNILRADRLTDVSVKIFTDSDKYINRLVQMKDLPKEDNITAMISGTLKSVSL